jgi:DNA-directed RNA polymerase subunit RPC12/RpoP
MSKKYLSENAELMKEWDWEQNANLNPEHLLNNSNKKAWWICAKCGNKWETAIYNRAGRDHTGCPYCARQKIMPGYNDLQTEYPKIAKEWHPTKNGNLTPSMVMGGSSKKAWWICSIGHAYQQSIAQRTSRNGSCPYCLGQKVLVGFNDLASNFPEIAKEWHPIKNGNLKPTQISKGSNKKFWWKCPKCNYEWEARVADRTKDHTGCPACANKVLVKGFNDLATKFPKVAAEWHPTKNGNLTPKDVKATSNKKVWWICPHKHEYEQAIMLRTTRGYGCPYCAGQKVWSGFNDLATSHPEIAKEWHPTKNGNLSRRFPYHACWLCTHDLWGISTILFCHFQKLRQMVLMFHF